MKQRKTDGRSRTTTDSRSPRARILIVGGEPEFRSSLVSALKERHHQCTHVNRIDEAQAALGQQRYGLLLVNPDLPDGDGLDLAQSVRKTHPTTKVIVFSGVGSFKVALRAIRCGAVDFIRTPTDLDEFTDRVDVALLRSLSEQHREQRMRRLQKICRELNTAREDVSEHVEALLADLVTAYQSLSDQVNEVQMSTEFKTLLSQELEMEEVLRTTLEYMLGKTGPTNAAVFLPDADQQYSLGAYVNYDCPRESIDTLLDHLGDAICPQMSQESSLVAFDDAREFADWIGMSDGLLAESQIVAFSCHHDGECVAVVVLFRHQSNPFNAELAGTLDVLRMIFAEQISQIIRIHHRATPDSPDEPTTEDEDEYDDDFGYGFAA